MTISESAVISIASSLRHPNASRIIRGIGDDCAVVRTPGAGAMLITTDVFIEGVHFLPNQPPESVGGKLLAVNLSDIAAMGGRPGEAVIAMMLPDTIAMEWIENFYKGVEVVARQFGVNLIGGDVSRHPDRISLALTLTGACRRDEILYRTGAKAGDYLYVSGFLGDADAGLELLKSSTDNEIAKPLNATLISKYLNPTPRIELGRLLARTRTASACIDLSDGIAVGSRQLVEASRLSVELNGDELPISDDLRDYCKFRSIDPFRFALESGGDYELLFAVPPASRRRVERFGLSRPELPRLRCIGRLTGGPPGMVLVDTAGKREELLTGGWEHFAKGN